MLGRKRSQEPENRMSQLGATAEEKRLYGRFTAVHNE